MEGKRSGEKKREGGGKIERGKKRGGRNPRQLKREIVFFKSGMGKICLF